MTISYSEFLLIFLVPFILLFAVIQRHKFMSPQVWYVLVMALVAFLYTPIWDNYLVANEVWWYDEDLVWGITLAWVPLEEYLFFILQPLMTGFGLLWLNDRLTPRGPREVNDPRFRHWTLGATFAFWLLNVVGFFFGPESLTYMTLILMWALPPVMIQLAYGADILRNRGRLVVIALLISSVYLSLADALAIYIGIWTISPAQTIGLYLGGVLPFEEALFFFMTNVLLVFGIVLYLEPESHRRLARLMAWVGRLRGGRRRGSPMLD